MEIIAKIKEKSPLIHAITNPISITACANAALALGARPIMAEHPKEVLGITESAQALLLNLGNITDVRMKSMLICAHTAAARDIPIVLDLVGVACSEFRKDFAKRIIKEAKPSVIKGNYSEIYAMYCDTYKSPGVDADILMTKEMITKASAELSREIGAIIIASGKTDVITDSKKTIYVDNGTELLSKITGTGCMLGIITACCLGVCCEIDAAVSACIILGVCGELSQNSKGSGSFSINLLDNLFSISDKELEKYKKTEEKKLEEI